MRAFCWRRSVVTRAGFSPATFPVISLVHLELVLSCAASVVGYIKLTTVISLGARYLQAFQSLRQSGLVTLVSFDDPFLFFISAVAS